jgi:hypothetical protein
VDSDANKPNEFHCLWRVITAMLLIIWAPKWTNICWPAEILSACRDGVPRMRQDVSLMSVPLTYVPFYVPHSYTVTRSHCEASNIGLLNRGFVGREWEALRKLQDTACSAEIRNRIRRIWYSSPTVLRL